MNKLRPRNSSVHWLVTDQLGTPRWRTDYQHHVSRPVSADARRWDNWPPNVYDEEPGDGCYNRRRKCPWHYMLLEIQSKEMTDILEQIADRFLRCCHDEYVDLSFLIWLVKDTLAEQDP